jgi:hypothetical protein
MAWPSGVEAGRDGLKRDGLEAALWARGRDGKVWRLMGKRLEGLEMDGSHGHEGRASGIVLWWGGEGGDGDLDDGDCAAWVEGWA